MASDKWHEECGFLELFLAYFERYQHSLARGKRYRDFLLDILLCHERVVHHCGLTIGPNPIYASNDGMPMLEPQVVVVDSPGRLKESFPSPKDSAVFSLEIPFKGNTSEDEMHGLSVKHEALLTANSDLDVEIEAEEVVERRKQTRLSAGEIKQEGELVVTDPMGSKWEPCEMIAWLSPKKNTPEGHRLSSSPPANNEDFEPQHSPLNGELSIDTDEHQVPEQDQHSESQLESESDCIKEVQQPPADVETENTEQAEEQAHSFQTREFEQRVLRLVKKKLRQRQQQKQQNQHPQRLEEERSANQSNRPQSSHSQNEEIDMWNGCQSSASLPPATHHQPLCSLPQSLQQQHPLSLTQSEEEQPRSRKRKRLSESQGSAEQRIGPVVDSPCSVDVNPIVTNSSSFLQLPLESPRKELDPLDLQLQPSLFERMSLLPSISPPIEGLDSSTSSSSCTLITPEMMSISRILGFPHQSSANSIQSETGLPASSRSHLRSSTASQSSFNIANCNRMQGRGTADFTLAKQPDANRVLSMPGPTNHVNAIYSRSVSPARAESVFSSHINHSSPPHVRQSAQMTPAIYTGSRASRAMPGPSFSGNLPNGSAGLQSSGTVNMQSTSVTLVRSKDANVVRQSAAVASAPPANRNSSSTVSLSTSGRNFDVIRVTPEVFSRAKAVSVAFEQQASRPLSRNPTANHAPSSAVVPNIMTRQRALNLLHGQTGGRSEQGVRITVNDSNASLNRALYERISATSQRSGNNVYGASGNSTPSASQASFLPDPGPSTELNMEPPNANNRHSAPGTPSTCPAEDESPISPGIPLTTADRPSVMAADSSQVFSVTEMDSMSLQNMFRCTFCEGCFFSYETFARHVCEQSQQEHGLQDFPCRLCGRCFKRLQDRTRHERCHSKRQESICPCCQRRFMKNSDMLTHMKTNCSRARR